MKIKERFIATKHPQGYFVSDIKADESTIMSDAEYLEAERFLKIKTMSTIEDTDSLRFLYDNIVCMGALDVNIDMSFYKLFHEEVDVSIQSSRNVNLYNIMDSEGDITIADSENVNIYTTYGVLGLCLSSNKNVSIVGIHDTLDTLNLTLSEAFSTKEQGEVQLKGIKEIQELELSIIEGFKYLKSYCFFHTEEKIKIGNITLDTLSETVCNNLINSTEGKPDLLIPVEVLDIYIFDAKRTVIDLTHFNVKSWTEEIGFQCHDTFIKDHSEEPTEVIIKVDNLYMEGIGKLSFNQGNMVVGMEEKLRFKIVKGKVTSDMVVKIIDMKGNERVEVYHA